MTPTGMASAVRKLVFRCHPFHCQKPSSTKLHVGLAQAENKYDIESRIY